MKFSLQVGHSTNSNIRTPLQFSKTPNGRVKDVQIIILGRKSSAHCTVTSNMASGSVTIPIWRPGGLRRTRALSFGPTNYD